MCWERLTRDDEAVETRATDVFREEDLERPELDVEPIDEAAEPQRERETVPV